MTPEKLKKYGVKISRIRKALVEEALKLENKAIVDMQSDFSQIIRLSKKAHKYVYGITVPQERIKFEDFIE